VRRRQDRGSRCRAAAVLAAALWCAGFGCAGFANGLAAQQGGGLLDGGDGEPWVLETGFSQSVVRGDVREITVAGGFQLTRGGVQLRADRAVITIDLDAERALQEGLARGGGLPRRGTELPPSRRRIDAPMLRGRLDSFLSATGRTRADDRNDDADAPTTRAAADLTPWRSIYLEGRVVLERDGLEVLRCSSLWYSILDDRGVFDDVTMRLDATTESTLPLIYTMRAPRLVRQGGRITGQSVALSTCAAGDPHYDVYSGEIEIIERDGAFEVRSRGNQFRFGGSGVSLPLPNISFFTDQQNQVPIKSAGVRYGQREQFQADILFGSNYNRLGGAIHNALTGRPASEFRGDWEFGIGYNQFRGVPLEGRLFYRGGDLYSGRIEVFHLNDDGFDLREIIRNYDRSLIDEDNRAMVRTENRIRLGEDTDLDLTLFDASDPAVLSEFFWEEYYTSEIPETSVFFRRQRDNRLMAINARWNLAEFSYADNRTLAESFTEELPVATYDVYSEPLFDIWENTPVTLTSRTSIGQLQRNFDNDVTDANFQTLSPSSTIAPSIDDRTLRVDQEVELAVQSRFLGLGFRPFVSARAIHYDRTPSSDYGSLTRGIFSAGAVLGTKLQRTFRWTDSTGTPHVLRHTMHPTFEVGHVFEADESPSDLFPFDPTEQIDERATMRIGLLQRFITEDSRERSRETGAREEFLWLDLAQNVFPISERDNGGEQLGLFEFEAIMQPSALVPWPEGLQVVVEGEYDWAQRDLRTFNSYLGFRVLDTRLFAEYRTDRTQDGQIIYGATKPVFDRWLLTGASSYDLESQQVFNYTSSIVRRDHDWDLVFQVRFNFVTDQTTFNILIEPKFGGGQRSPRNRFFNGPRNSPGNF
jgi:hypothetical protein